MACPVSMSNFIQGSRHTEPVFIKKHCRTRMVLKLVLFTGIVRRKEDGWLSRDMGG